MRLQKTASFRVGKEAAEEEVRGGILVELPAGMLDSGNKTKFWREFQVASAWVGGLAQALRIRLAVAVLVDGEGEGHQFKDAETETGDGLAGSMDESVRTSGRAAFLTIGFKKLVRDFRHTVNDVGNSAAQFADRAVLLSRRGLEVSHAQAGDADGQENQDGFFHKKSQYG